MTLSKGFTESATPDIIGDPEATTEPVLQLIDSANPPLRLLLGKIAYPAIKKRYEQRLASFEEWAEVSAAAHGNA